MLQEGDDTTGQAWHKLRVPTTFALLLHPQPSRKHVATLKGCTNADMPGVLTAN